MSLQKVPPSQTQLARKQFPGGTLIDIPYKEYERRVAETRAAMDAGAPAVFEAAFVADGVFVAVDILLRDGTATAKAHRRGRGEAEDAEKNLGGNGGTSSWRLIEVKSSKW